MKFHMSKEWLAKHLQRTPDDGVQIEAAGISLEELKADTRSRFTSASLVGLPTSVGKVIRVARERKGWSVYELSQQSDVASKDIDDLERDINYSPTPRTVHNLAEALQLAENRLQSLVGHRIPLSKIASNDASVLFAANSGKIDSITIDDYEIVRLFVESITKND